MPARNLWLLASLPARLSRFARRLHSDERGTIGILTVFALFLFTILLVMITNIARQMDDKIRMQNGADAAAYTGGTVIARGMNSIAFSNHLLCEVCGLTAYMREGKAAGEGRGSDQLVPEILDRWREIGPIFAGSPFQKFSRLGSAITNKVPLEQEVVSTYARMSARHSSLTLPVLEYILRGGGEGEEPDPQGGFLPQFNRGMVQYTPAMAHQATLEIARRYGERTQSQHRGQTMQAYLWRVALPQSPGEIEAVSFGNESDPFRRTLPAIDPSPTGMDGPPNGRYLTTARSQRESLARHYLELWIRDWMGPYFSYDGNSPGPPGRNTAKMSQYINLWRIATCGYLRKLLDEEYPTTNLPHVIRDETMPEVDHTFVAVAYWPHLSQSFPGLFRNRLDQRTSTGETLYDAETFAQATVFLPRSRYLCCPWAWPTYYTDEFGMPQIRWILNMEGVPRDWSLLSQNWTVKLIPATTANLPQILTRQPPGLNNFRPPQLGDATLQDLNNVNTH